MALSFEQFSGDGINRQFPIDFGYLSRDHISVTVDGVAVAFTFLNNGLVQTAVAPAAGTVVEVRRSTPRETPLTDFVDGSTLTEADLDTATLQTFYLAQEAYDIAGGTLGIQPDGSYSANNRRIGTVADPTGPQDVVNKRYFEATFLPQQTNLLNLTTAQKEAAVAARLGSETALAAALAARDLALQHRDNAKAWYDGAVAAKDAAYGFQQGAYTHYSNAYGAYTSADAARVAAQAARDVALQHRDASYTAEANAYAARDKAQAWAEKTDSAVEPGKYSAKAWANDAQIYRNTTLTYRNDAETFKNQAAASAAAAALFDPSSYVTKAGGTYNGNLTIRGTWPSLSLDKTASGSGTQIVGSTNGSLRWCIRPGDDVAEDGAGGGSDFSILRFGDNGAWIDAPMRISRKTGIMSLLGRPSWGATPWDSVNLPSPWNAANLPDPGWRALPVYRATGSTAAADFTIPAGTKAIRITGIADVGGSAVSLIMRVSIDNGATFKSGATEYAYSYLSQSGTTSGGATQVTFPHLFLSSSSDNANIGMQPVHAIIGNGSATRVFRYMSSSSYYVSSSGSGTINFHGYANFFGAITNIRLLMTSGNIPAGTVLTLEYLI